MKGKSTCFVESSDSDIKKKTYLKCCYGQYKNVNKIYCQRTIGKSMGGLCKGGGKEGGLYKFTPFWLTCMSVGNDL